VIDADHSPVTILRVMPRDFDFPHNVDLWYPAPSASLSRTLDIRVYRWGASRSNSCAMLAISAGPCASSIAGLGVRADSLAQAMYGNARPAVDPIQTLRHE
jgi:hypothetical protein